MHSFRLKTKFILVIVAMAVFMGGILTAFVQVYVSDLFADEFKKRGFVLAGHIATTNANAILTGDLRSTQIDITDMKREYQESIEYIFIIDRNRAVVAHTFSDSVPINLINANILASGKNLSIMPIVVFGKRVEDVAVPSLGTGLGEVHVGMKSEVIRRGVNGITFRMLGVISCILAIFCIVAIFFSLRLSRSVSALSRAALKIEGGDLTVNLETNGSDEIAELAGAINKMVVTLKERIQEISSLNQGLESRVLERTAELATSKEALQEEQRQLNLQNETLANMQAEMLQQKAFAEGVLNKAAVPIFVLDVNHRIIVWNSAMEDLTGLGAEEMLGSNRQWFPFYEHARPVLADLVLSEDDSKLAEFYNIHRTSQHVSGGQQAEGWLENVGGKKRYLLFDAAPVFDSNNIKLGVIETLLDITERKLAEDEQRKLSWAVSENPCSIVITDPEGTIEYVNRKFCELTGYTALEAVGQNPRVLKSGETDNEVYAELWYEILHGRTWRGELKNKKKNGELYWELALISPVMDKEGRITNFLAVKEDITQRKLNEVELAASKEALQEQHKKLNQVFQQMEKAKREWETTLDCISDMVLMCDTWGKIKRCNRPITSLTGLGYEEIIDKNWMTILVNVGIQVVDFDGQHGNLLDTGSGRSYEMNVSPIKLPESPLQSGTVVSIHDTTVMNAMNRKLEEAYSELQHTQSQILQQEKMASIGQLAAGVAHEINNPMGFISSNLGSLGKYMEKISGFNAALMETVQSRCDQETLNTLNELRKKMKIDFILGDISGLLAESHDGAERVRRIVQDLKSFSHVDEVECKPFSINECLTSTLNMARNEIKYVADVEQEYDPDLPLLNCYPQQLNQVFMNILVNAGHAIEGHGVIKITTRREADDIVVRISDTGKGIPPENLTRIFEPFFTTKEVGKGTGLGLSISYDIIKKHGGVMDVKSEVGVGTTFTIRLPLNHQFTTAVS